MLDDTPTDVAADLSRRIAGLPWRQFTDELEASGSVLIDGLLTPLECRGLADLYADDARFRSRVVMERHGFGRGEYRYFAYPLPPAVAALRRGVYPYLAPVANRWWQALKRAPAFPDDHERFLDRCREAGQTRPTPLLLRYGEGDYNCLHQDVYGEQVFPLQMTVLLSAPGTDFTGGEFVLTEQRPRMQSRPAVMPLRQGDAVVFAVRERPAAGRRGFYRVNMRHGVSRVRSGRRTTLGIIFHDAA